MKKIDGAFHFSVTSSGQTEDTKQASAKVGVIPFGEVDDITLQPRDQIGPDSLLSADKSLQTVVLEKGQYNEQEVWIVTGYRKVNLQAKTYCLLSSQKVASILFPSRSKTKQP